MQQALDFRHRLCKKNEQIIVECNFESKAEIPTLMLLKKLPESQREKAVLALNQLPAGERESSLSADDRATHRGGWAVMRQRFDKDANALRTADSVLESIKNPVDAADLASITESLREQFCTDFAGLGKRGRPEDDDEFGD